VRRSPANRNCDQSCSPVATTFLYLWLWRQIVEMLLLRNFWTTISKRFALCYQTVVCPVLPVVSVCNVGVLWPNGWMDQDETWHASRPRTGHIVLDGDPASPPPKGHSPQFLTLSVMAKRLDQGATWYGGRPRPRRHCVRWGPISPSP